MPTPSIIIKGAPGVVTQAQLDELSIAVTATEEEEEG